MQIREPVFKVTQRSVREKFSKMIENFRKKEAREGDVEYDEITKGLTDIEDRRVNQNNEIYLYVYFSPCVLWVEK